MTLSPPRRRLWLWVALALPVLAILALLFAVAQMRSWLHSDSFRRLLSSKVSQNIKADGEFAALEWTGSSFYSQSYRADGLVGANFRSIEAGQIRATGNLRGILDRKWQVDAVEIERLRIVAGDGVAIREKIETPAPQKTTVPAKKARPGWLPNQVELREVTIADFGLDTFSTDWPVRLDGVSLTATPDGEAWKLISNGGHLNHEGWPRIELGDTNLRYASGMLYVTNASLHSTTGGALDITGQVSFETPEATDLTFDLAALPAESVLPEDWRGKLHGKLFGKIRVRPGANGLTGEGSMELKEGHLEALPVLDQIAIFTRTQRFRQLALENVHGDVCQEGDLTTVKNFNAESPGLIRLTGNFTISKGRIEGEFLVGLTPGSLRWIPGSQEKVFTLEREGWLWTTMKVTGPVKAPREDLSSRLAVAAGQELIERLEKDPDSLKDTLKDAAQSLLDLLGK